MVSPSAPISCNAMPRSDSKTEMTNRRWMRRLRGKWLLMLAALPSCVLAGPPFRTDDPAVVEYKHFELIAFYQQSLAGGGRSGVMPGFEFHYGAFDKVELDLVTPFAFNSPSAASTERGYGDTELGVKYRLIEETDSMPLVSFTPLLDLPTGNSGRGLGNGGSAVFLALSLQKSWRDLQSYGEIGYWINNGANNRSYWFVGWQAQFQFSANWVLGAEIFHTTPRMLGEGASTGFNVGGSYVIDAHNQLLFSGGKGLQNAAQTNGVSTYVGYQLSY